MGKIEDKDIDLHIDRETLLQEYIPKADYVNRLKADMVAILDKIRDEIDNALSDGMIHKKTVLGIIDKYKADRSVEDGNDA